MRTQEMADRLDQRAGKLDKFGTEFSTESAKTAREGAKLIRECQELINRSKTAGRAGQPVIRGPETGHATPHDSVNS